MSTIDFSKMNDADLLKSVYRIDRAAFPANYDAATAEIKKRGLQTTELFKEIDPYAPRPWLRFWAKSIDAMLVSVFFGYIMIFLVGVRPTNSFQGWALFLVFNSLYEGVAIHLTGTTFGKNACGISVKKFENPPSWKEAFHRSLSCSVWGSGLGILSLITYIISYLRLKSTGTTKWDKAAGTVVKTDGISPSAFLLALVLTAIFIALSIHSLKELASDSKAKCALECELLRTNGQLKAGMNIEQCVQETCK